MIEAEIKSASFLPQIPLNLPRKSEIAYSQTKPLPVALKLKKKTNRKMRKKRAKKAGKKLGLNELAILAQTRNSMHNMEANNNPLQQPQNNPPQIAKLSKSARKRANKRARKALEAITNSSKRINNSISHHQLNH